MNIKDILNYSLFEADDFNLTVYELAFAILILVITSIIVRVFKKILTRGERNKNFDEARSHTVFQIAKYLLWILAILLALQTIGIKVTILLAGSAALLVGLGLGLQQIFQDIMSGITILFEGTIKVGDIVEIENGSIGRVVEVGIRTSKMESRDNIIMIIPNSRFVNDNVINWSHMEKRTRFFVSVGVAYGSDVDKVTDILLNCAKAQKEIANAPLPFVRFKDFGDSSLDFEVYFWTTQAFQAEDIKSRIRYQINAEFKKQNVQIPFPQRDLHIKSGTI